MVRPSAPAACALERQADEVRPPRGQGHVEPAEQIHVQQALSGPRSGDAAEVPEGGGEGGGGAAVGGERGAGEEAGDGGGGHGGGAERPGVNHLAGG